VCIDAVVEYSKPSGRFRFGHQSVNRCCHS
jgi:hypothetical protein